MRSKGLLTLASQKIKFSRSQRRFLWPHFFLAPVYLAVCFYVLNWMLKWMAVCNNIFALAAFRYGFSALYILTATTLLSSFLSKSRWTASDFKTHQQLWLGTFLYALIGIGIADFIRILLYFSPLADASWFHSRLMFAATGLFTGVLILFFSFYGFSAKKLYTTTWNISSAKSCSGHDTLKIALIADRFGL